MGFPESQEKMVVGSYIGGSSAIGIFNSFHRKFSLGAVYIRHILITPNPDEPELNSKSEIQNPKSKIRNKFKIQNSKLKTNETDTWHFVSLHIAICYEILCQKKHESQN